MNVLDYIKWRSDLTFDERELNELDSLIFSYLAYENFDVILDQPKTIKQVSDEFFKLYDKKMLENRKTFSKKSYLVLEAIANKPRYQSLVLSNYVNEIDYDQDLQFSALTIQYKEKWKYIAFRGTDDTFTGWKEDFSMAYKEVVLSQRKASEYVDRVFYEDSYLTRIFNQCDYYLGGHSKGGNLAMYAGGMVANDIQKKIKRIDNFDGPGFELKTWEKPFIQNIISKIHTYVPTSSLFGRLFEHREQVKIVKSDAFGLLQHHPLYWHVHVDHFQYEDAVTSGSEKAVEKFNLMLQEYDRNQREKLIESLFDIFKRLEVYTFDDLLNIDLNRILQVLKELSDLDNEQKKLIMEFLHIILKASDLR